MPLHYLRGVPYGEAGDEALRRLQGHLLLRCGMPTCALERAPRGLPRGAQAERGFPRGERAVARTRANPWRANSWRAHLTHRRYKQLCNVTERRHASSLCAPCVRVSHVCASLSPCIAVRCPFSSVLSQLPPPLNPCPPLPFQSVPANARQRARKRRVARRAGLARNRAPFTPRHTPLPRQRLQ